MMANPIEIPYDGIDQDLDGSDLIDVDGDGYASVLAGGQDCDDRRPWVHPHAWDAPGDGVDANCDGDDPDGPWQRPRWSRWARIRAVRRTP
jgi:hypothetical protein